MSKSFPLSVARPGVITANDLREGHNLWMCADGWTPDPRQATVYDDEAIADLALLEAVAQSEVVVGPYLVEAKRGPNGPEPVHFREAFRQRGPSNYFHGIQADQQAEASHV
ncbi:DUF2849 domain-containing protein [Paracoccus sp. Ld10]|uniref:DUF2849 domain-containing protein n=1 Tax=Paracoccus sp. Ld10 TaxID=649158 RepID=UPI0038644D0F